MKKLNAMQRLNAIIKERGPLVAGLDPEFEKILPLWEASDGSITKEDFDEEELFIDTVLYRYCTEYLKSLPPEVGVVKINSAFFESKGLEDLYINLAEDAKQLGLFVIGDVKRADIGNTSKMYAEAFLYEDSPFDAVTINPYFGTDGVQPFFDLAKKNGKGVFVLVKTSNKTSAEIQDAILADGRPVYALVADLVNQLGRYTDPEGTEDYNLVGAVVGATHPEQAAELRKLMPNTFFLVPGYGAQGATAQDITVNFDSEGGGAVVNSSRGIMMACNNARWKDKFTQNEWAEAATAECIRATAELKEAIANR